MQRLVALLSRFRKDEQGAFMVLFAVLALVLIATSGAVVDFTATQTARSRAQTALDSAALALQTRISLDSNATIVSKAQTLLTQRIGDASITATVTSATIDTVAGKLNLQAQIVVPTAFVQLVGISTITAHLQSEVTRGSTNLEVSVALDTTGSMGTPSSKIQGLRDATDSLIDLVVKDVQTPTTTRLALVPYSYGVNMGSYAAKVRGPITGGTAITAASWSKSTAKAIVSITQNSPAVVTMGATNSVNGFANGDYIYITGVTGMTQLNSTASKLYIIQGATAPGTTFQLYTDASPSVKVDSSGYSKATKNTGTVTECQVSTCEVVVTSNAHGLANGDDVYVTGVKGMTGINTSDIDNPGSVAAVTTNTFVMTGEFGPSNGAYTSSGTAYCVKLGCQYYNFTNWDGDGQTFSSSNCVTERTGTHKYDDTAPGTASTVTAPVGYMYPSTSTNCVSQSIVPLSSDKINLHTVADSLTAAGSTAGHIGLAWAWYMVAPNFGYLWPTASQPLAYKANNLIKAVILMTDGQFNTQYCNGVISKDSDNIDGSANMINCNGTNGESVDQATALCTAIKDASTGIILYTVGFDIGTSSTTDKAARSFLSGCATDTDHFYLASTAADLNGAFTQIAQNLSELRLSK